MAYLFDTDAISELLRKKPPPAYVLWLGGVAREDQFTSAVTVGELFRGAFRSADRNRHLKNIEERVLPAMSVLPFDTGVARVYGRLCADLESAGRPLADADLLPALRERGEETLRRVKERLSDRRHQERRLAELERDLTSEPERIRRSFEVRATRLEPVGLACLWPVSG